MSGNNPKLTTDGILISNDKILFIKRKNEPFKGKWALPGGFVEYKEKVEDAVIREFHEETGLKTKIIDFLGVYSDPERDPRGHTITLVYLLQKIGGKLKANDDASDVKFFKISSLPTLAFDHDKIVKDFLRRDK